MYLYYGHYTPPYPCLLIHSALIDTLLVAMNTFPSISSGPLMLANGVVNTIHEVAMLSKRDEMDTMFEDLMMMARSAGYVSAYP